ncbi:MAG TPA: peptidylprolyl isomerase [Acidimicrobiales bacterium]|nr:peptidylprolyl isomerase [Acidimicrobiales bacterium]
MPVTASSNASPSVRTPGRRRRTRGVLALALITIVALVASSCSSGQAWIARVDNSPIDSPNFWDGVPLYSSLASGGSAPVPEDDKGISPMSDAATYAMFLIQLHGLKTLNADHGTKVTEADLTRTRQSLLASQQASLFKDLPSWFLDQIVLAQAYYEALINYYGKDADLDAQIKAYYDANKDQFRQVCMDVIGGEEAELMAARQRLDEGAEFATVAKAVASAQPADATTGQAAQALGEKADGDVGCVPISTVSNLFADPSGVTALTEAPANAIVGPVPVAGGTFMLFRVRSTETQPLAEARPAIEQSIGQPGQEQAQKALNDFLTKADIDLNPRIGSWENGVGYQPPGGAEQPPGQTTTVPVALGGAGG